MSNRKASRRCFLQFCDQNAVVGIETGNTLDDREREAVMWRVKVTNMLLETGAITKFRVDVIGLPNCPYAVNG